MTWQVKKKNILCLTLFMLVLMEVSGQNKQNKSVSITGQISDEADELLVGANVWLISKTDTLNKQGVATNEGAFIRLTLVRVNTKSGCRTSAILPIWRKCMHSKASRCQTLR